LFGSEPFSSYLRISNIKDYKYDWVWVKNRVSNYLNAKKQPLRSYETVSVFYEKQCRYNPIPFSNEVYSNRSSKLVERGTANYGDHTIQLSTETRQITSAKNVLYFDTVHPNSYEYKGHPTQKPVALLEYLIKTYTLEGETVLDNCAGSFTTAVACDNINRNWICIEKEEEYCNIGLTRINDNRERLSLPLLKLYNSRGDLIGEDD
jgi:site-specific DNA-methyltransferase (adenine-specific)